MDRIYILAKLAQTKLSSNKIKQEIEDIRLRGERTRVEPEERLKAKKLEGELGRAQTEQRLKDIETKSKLKRAPDVSRLEDIKLEGELGRAQREGYIKDIKADSELKKLRHPYRAQLAEGLRDLAKSAPKAVLSGGGTLVAPILAEKLKAKFGPKPSLAQQLLGKGTLGRGALSLGLGAAAIGGGVSAADKLYESIAKPLEKKRSFKKMMAFSPGLKKEDPKAISSIFGTLYRFNPKMASDPLVASSFMKRSLQFKDEGIQPMDVKTLTEVGKNLAATKGKGPSILGEAFPTAASALVGLG